MDLSVADEHCLKTTEYVLSAIDVLKGFGIPIRRLLVFIKDWTKRCGINNALKCYLNSFGYTLMAIHFCLMICCGDEFTIEDTQKISCLIAGFFSFYGFTFDASVHCIDITKRELFCDKVRLDILEIVDPVNRQNNVAK